MLYVIGILLVLELVVDSYVILLSHELLDRLNALRGPSDPIPDGEE